MLQVQTRIIRLVDIATVFFVFFFVFVTYFKSWLIYLFCHFFFFFYIFRFGYGNGFLYWKRLNIFCLAWKRLFYRIEFDFYRLRIFVLLGLELKRLFFFFLSRFLRAVFFFKLIIILNFYIPFIGRFCRKAVSIYRLSNFITLGQRGVEGFPNNINCSFGEKNADKNACY